MEPLEYGRHCTEIVEQTGQLRELTVRADLSATVPSCPDWTLGDLVTHVGGALRWAAAIVRTRASADVPDEDVPEMAGPGVRDPMALGDWLAQGAELLVGALREAGSGTRVWTWAEQQRTDFWARRMAHEVVVHRADAALAAGVEFAVDARLAADTVEEWLELVSAAQDQGDPDLADLSQKAGQSIQLDTVNAPLRPAGWLIEFTEQGFGWRRGQQAATVTVRGSMAAVLQVFYRRLPVTSDQIELLGDPELLDFWLARTSFD